MEKILVLNSGSSSLKYQLFNVDGDKFEVVAKGLADRIGIEGSLVTIKVGDGDKVTTELPLPTHKEAIKEVLDLLLGSVLKSIDELSGVGHRVVHGGEYFDRSVLVDDEVIRIIDGLSTLAPLHNPAAVMGIKAVKALLPNVPQVVAFDTAFHQTMKPEAYMYALPLEQYKKYKIRRYGAHGTSHLFVSREAAKLIGKAGKIITCHIGNGGSITAVLNGKSYDTSMGFSPVDGLVMGTRCGNVDPSAVTFIGEKEQMSYAEVNNMLNKQSGVFGVSGVSSDMRDIDRAYDEGNPRAILARDMYYGRIKKFIGEYAAEMGGVDMIIFTGGVGENSCEMREAVCTGLEFMGVKFDPAANKGARGVNKILSAADSKVKVATIATNEELVIATDTYNLVK